MKRFRSTFSLAALGLLAACATPGGEAQPTRIQPSTAEPTPMPSGQSILLAAQEAQTGAYHILAVDPASGARSPAFAAIDFRGAGGAIAAYALAPNGRTLAVASGKSQYCEPSAGGTACWQGSGVLELLDLEGGRTSSVELPHPSRVSSMVFDPTGQRIAIVIHTRQGRRVMTFSLAQGAPLAEADLPVDPSLCGDSCTSLAFTRDGENLVVFGADPGQKPGIGQPGPAEVFLLESDSLVVAWTYTLDGFLVGSWCLEGCQSNQETRRGAVWFPAVTMPPGTDRLLLLHAEAERLTSIDLGQRLVQSMDIHSSQTFLDRLMGWGAIPAEAKGWSEGAMKQAVVSPDGSRLYTVGRLFHTRLNADGTMDGWEEPLGLDIVDPSTGVRLAHLDTKAFGLKLSVDGRWVLLATWESYGIVSELVDAQTLETAAAFEGWEILPVRSLEGRGLLLAFSASEVSTRFALIDPSTMERSRAWAVDGPAYVITP